MGQIKRVEKVGEVQGQQRDPRELNCLLFSNLAKVGLVYYLRFIKSVENKFCLFLMN